MSDLLLDVPKMATDAWHEIGRRQLRDDYEGAKSVIGALLHAAILAERQRCADVAEGFRQAHDTGSGFDSQPARATAEAIKDIILNPH